jgi:hypothetical protein
MPLGRSESLPLGLAMDLSYAATPLAGNQRHTLSCERREIAAAVLSQAGAPLSWTSERADTFFRLRRE